jgi:hypothetical protein
VEGLPQPTKKETTTINFARQARIKKTHEESRRIHADISFSPIGYYFSNFTIKTAWQGSCNVNRQASCTKVCGAFQMPINMVELPK